ncbi:MAG: DNA-binding YbaB/EbfC family protein [Flavobacteriaceae bacterium]|jgi:DNA-binding YbaB/EbfC family protein
MPQNYLPQENRFLEFSIFICCNSKNMVNNDLLNKLESLKRESEASKDRLEDVLISEESGGGLIRISMNGNRKIQDLEITADISKMDKEELQELICVAFNRVLDKVNELNEKEVMSSAQSLFTGL